MAPRPGVYFLRIDSIQTFGPIPYRRQATDSIHGFAVVLLELNQAFNQRLKRCFFVSYSENRFCAFYIVALYLNYAHLIMKKALTLGANYDKIFFE